MDTKTVAFILVGVLLGAGIGVAVGYSFGGDSNDNETYETYWYFFDFGDKANDTNVNKWVKVEAADVVSGLKKAADKEYTDNNIADSGWITSISGVTNDSGAKLSWANWFFNQASGYNSYGSWLQTQGMDVTPGNVFYIGFFGYDDTTWAPDVDPNTDRTEWKSEGPFA